ncbi:M14 family metallopeptidase [Nafulsella turpanensis]|uniref:M14 family metallopeptidase n=1 Tax=Nafulsella turpanensis TaxID=1265690 RepID=UPI000477B961|nr:M14 family metallopeptidase [Nafulsella turpanensis]
MIKKLLLVFMLCIISHSMQAQENKLQSPEEFLGYPIGDKFTYHHRVLGYFQYIAENSENVKLEEYGTSYEGRPLMVAYVGTEENLKRLEEISRNNLERAGVVEGDAPEEGPAIGWLSYNVHGNEAVSTEAAMRVLYTLAGGENEEAQEWLENTLIIIDPVLNPDGRERYVNWYNQVGNLTPNPNPDALEHHEPWPGGRPNHYLFDLNRDWAWQTQKESQLRMALYNQWLPHIHADFHEQGIESPYYFAPAAEPFHDYVTDWQREFQTTIGLNTTKYFDEEGWLYFTRERFDLFYPSYGDTYPTFNGAIGMTIEQGGSGRAGLAVRTAEGDTLTLKERIQHHYITSLSTIESTSENAEEVVEKFEEFFEETSENPPGIYKTYLVSQQNDADKLQALRNFLDLHQIEYQQATGKDTYKGWNYQETQISKFRTNPGDWIIPASQAKGLLLQVLFEPESKLSDSVTYDITAWAVPYMMDLQAYATTEEIEGTPVPDSPDYELNLPTEQPYAYLLEWNSLEDVKFLSRLLKAGIKVRFAEEPFVTGNKECGRGTLIITRRGNEGLGERFDYIVREAAREWERPLQATGTGFVTEGKDFGSGSVHYLEKPQVAVLAGEGVSSLAFGEVWHYFEQQIGYPLTVIETSNAEEVDWSNYDVLIAPDGNYSEVLDKEMLEKLNSWVREGGRLILMQNAIAAVAESKSFNINEKEKQDSEEENPEDRLREYENRERESISSYNPGSIYRVSLDPSHPLAFGYEDDYFSLKTDAEAYQYLEEGWNVGTIRSQEDLVSGFVGYKAKEALGETLVFGVEEKGRGEVIYMTDNPLFRAFWQGGKLLFSNAVFLVGQE